MLWLISLRNLCCCWPRKWFLLLLFFFCFFFCFSFFFSYIFRLRCVAWKEFSGLFATLPLLDLRTIPARALWTEKKKIYFFYTKNGNMKVKGDTRSRRLKAGVKKYIYIYISTAVSSQTQEDSLERIEIPIELSRVKSNPVKTQWNIAKPSKTRSNPFWWSETQ